MAAVPSIRLELDSLRILRKRERWKIYFLVATEMPEDPSKTVVARFPDGEPIQLTRKTDNEVEFAPKGPNTEGMFLLERAMPADGTLRVSVYVMQQRDGLRKAGNIIEELGSMGGDNNVASVLKSLGGATPWTVVGGLAGKGISGVGKLLEEAKDRQLGFISMDESFTNDFDNTNEVPRSAKLASGNAEIAWSWVLASK